MILKKIELVLLVALICVTNVAIGQFNIKVGYTGGFMKAPDLNRIVDNFNTKYDKFSDQLDQFKSLHGLELGLRYRIGSVGAELSWSNLTDNSDVITTLPTGTVLQDKWFLSMTEYSFGLENYIGLFGYGASIGYRTARMKTDIPQSRRKKQLITEESAFTNKFYLLFQAPGSKVSLVFKPYIQLPLGNINVSGFDQGLNEQIDASYQAVRIQEERFFMYGISILLYNGRQ